MADGYQLTKEQRERAEEMVRGGKTIAEIHRALRVPYRDIWAFSKSVDAPSWLGAKRIITRRLSDMVKSSSRARRVELAAEANEMVEYLYYECRDQGDMVERVRRIVG